MAEAPVIPQATSAEAPEIFARILSRCRTPEDAEVALLAEALNRARSDELGLAIPREALPSPVPLQIAFDPDTNARESADVVRVNPAPNGEIATDNRTCLLQRAQLGASGPEMRVVAPGWPAGHAVEQPGPPAETTVFGAIITDSTEPAPEFRQGRPDRNKPVRLESSGERPSSEYASRERQSCDALEPRTVPGRSPKETERKLQPVRRIPPQSGSETSDPALPRRVRVRSHEAAARQEAGASPLTPAAGGRELPGQAQQIEPPSSPAAPLEAAKTVHAGRRELILQIPNPAGGKPGIEVRVSERAGALHVVVRSPDAEVTRALRSELMELVRTLDASGLKTETWTPADTHPFAEARLAETGSPGASDQRFGSSGQQARDHGNDPDSNGRRNPQKASGWLTELERELQEEETEK